MARAKKIQAVVRPTTDELEWVVEAQDGSRLSAQHYIPHRAVAALEAKLRERLGVEVTVEYTFVLPEDMQGKVDEHLALEREMKELTESIPRKRMALVEALTERHLKLQDMAPIMRLSKSYLSGLIKRGAHDEYTKMRARRKTSA